MLQFSLLKRVVYSNIMPRRERRRRKFCEIYKKIIILLGKINDFYMEFEIFGGAEGAAENFCLHEEKNRCNFFRFGGAASGGGLVS